MAKAMEDRVHRIPTSRSSSASLPTSVRPTTMPHKRRSTLGLYFLPCGQGIVTRRPLVQLVHTPARSPPPDHSSLDAPSVPTHTKWGNAFSRQTVHDVDKIRKAFAESVPAAASPSRTPCVQNPLLRITKIPVSGVKKYTELEA